MDQSIREAIEDKDLERVRTLIVKYGLPESSSVIREKVRSSFFFPSDIRKTILRATESMFVERKIMVFDIECKVT